MKWPLVVFKSIFIKCPLPGSEDYTHQDASKRKPDEVKMTHFGTEVYTQKRMQQLLLERYEGH